MWWVGDAGILVYWHPTLLLLCNHACGGEGQRQLLLLLLLHVQDLA